MIDFHPVVLHYPIVLISVVPVFDSLSLLTKKSFENLALWSLFFGVAFLIPTLLTGLLAAKFYPPTKAILINHRTMAFIASGFSLLHLFFRFYLKRQNIVSRGKWLILLSVINFVLIAVTSDLGGILAFGRSPFFGR